MFDVINTFAILCKYYHLIYIPIFVEILICLLLQSPTNDDPKDIVPILFLKLLLSLIESFKVVESIESISQLPSVLKMLASLCPWLEPKDKQLVSRELKFHSL